MYWWDNTEDYIHFIYAVKHSFISPSKSAFLVFVTSELVCLYRIPKVVSSFDHLEKMVIYSITYKAVIYSRARKFIATDLSDVIDSKTLW